jgi:hypothetical protein
MGMFSWECKGCDQELKEDEIVRLNGCRGIYDGYGRAGGFDASNTNFKVFGWHELCYQAASDAEKLDETPSKNARNQGFGYPRKDCMPEDSRGTRYYEEPPRLFYKDIPSESINEYLDFLAEEDEKGEGYSFFANGHLGDGEKIKRGHITDGDVERAKLARGNRFDHAVKHKPLKGFEYSEGELAMMEKFDTTYNLVSELAHDALNAAKRRHFGN